SRHGLLHILHMRDEDFRRQFRFEKADLGALLSALKVPESFTSAQGVVVRDDEALCFMLRRLAYPKWTLVYRRVQPSGDAKGFTARTSRRRQRSSSTVNCSLRVAC
ncbi:hypothetical protein HPB47_008801, partial [Ixodes persulcatus]